MVSRCSYLALILCLLLLFFPNRASAGLYYSGESYAELPSQWRGFLLDHRTLRNIAIKPTRGTAESPARVRYLEEAARLEKISRERRLTGDELADLGALYVRLGEPAKAVTVLRAAQREYPNHFFIAANLGTAWQLHGDLQQAALALREAVRLAPGKLQKPEEYHLKLVTQRQQKNAGDLDDLFGIRFGGGKTYEPGKLSDVEKKKLPANAVAIAQQLALWLPGDGRLLWQLAELANAHGDVKIAAAMMEGCVTTFQMHSPVLRQRRQLLKEAADVLAKVPTDKSKEHEGHVSGIAARSKRPLISKLDMLPLPPVSDSGTNFLPWELLAETVVDAKYRPTFAKYLKELEGHTVSITGFMQPLSEDAEANGFMFIEYPVGCWYCEMPETTSIIYVELPAGKSVRIGPGLVRVTGRLTLNATDPEDFLYAVRQARVGPVD